MDHLETRIQVPFLIKHSVQSMQIYIKKGKRKVQGVPQSQATAIPRDHLLYSPLFEALLDFFNPCPAELGYTLPLLTE